MTPEYPQDDEPLIPMPALSLPALRQAVAAVAPSRLPEFFLEIQDAFTQAGDEDSVFAIHHFHQRWGATIAIERRPSVAARLHDTGRELAPGVRLGSPVTIETRCIADWGIWVDGSGIVEGAATESAGRHLS